MPRSVVAAIALVLLCGCEKRLLRGVEPPASKPRAVAGQVEARPTPSGEARGWYLKALALEQHGDLAGAEAAIAWAVRLDPRDPWVHLAKARFLLAQGRTAEGAAACEAAIAVEPALAEAARCLGDARVRLGDDAGAEAPLVQAVAGAAAVRPGETDAHVLLARLYLRQGRPDAAGALYDAWDPAGMRGFDALERGRIGLDAGRDAPAVDDLLRALADPDVPPDALGLLASAATRSCRIGRAWAWTVDHGLADRPDAAWREQAAAVGVAARDPQLVARAGGDAAAIPPAPPVDHGWVDRARAHDADALARPPCDSGALREYAATLDALDAIPWLERAVEASPIDIEAVAALAAAYDAAGMPPRPRFDPVPP